MNLRIIASCEETDLHMLVENKKNPFGEMAGADLRQKKTALRLKTHGYNR